MLLVLFAPAHAGALDDPMLQVNGELGYACYADERRLHGAYAGAEGAWLFDGFWGLRGGYAYAEHRSKGKAFSVHQASLGLRYQLDVFEYVPWLDVSGVGYSSGGTDAREISGGLAFGLGFDWLMNPNWSLGFVGRYHQVFGNERFPAYLTAGLRLGYRWTPGDPFDD